MALFISSHVTSRMWCRQIVREEMEWRKHAEAMNGLAAANGVKMDTQEPLKKR